MWVILYASFCKLSGFIPPSCTTIKWVGETVPWVTNCETRKKSHQSRRVTVWSTTVPGGGLFIAPLYMRKKTPNIHMKMWSTLLEQKKHNNNSKEIIKKKKLTTFWNKRVLILFWTTTIVNFGSNEGPIDWNADKNCAASWAAANCNCPSPTPSRNKTICFG